MTSRQEQHWFRTYAAQTYRGIGAIVDLGCFFGETTISLAEGTAAKFQGRAEAHTCLRPFHLGRILRSLG